MGQAMHPNYVHSVFVDHSPNPAKLCGARKILTAATDVTSDWDSLACSCVTFDAPGIHCQTLTAAVAAMHECVAPETPSGTLCRHGAYRQIRT